MNGSVFGPPTTLRVGGNRALKVSDGFITFDIEGTEMNIRASAIDAYRLTNVAGPNGVEVPSIEVTLSGHEFLCHVYDPCVEDWVEFNDAVKSCRTAVKGVSA